MMPISHSGRLHLTCNQDVARHTGVRIPLSAQSRQMARINNLKTLL